MRDRKLTALASCAALAMMFPAAGYAQDAAFSQLFNEQCAVCHGENLLGAAQGTPLVGNELIHGDAITNIAESIAKGLPEKGMPSWSETLSATQIRTLAIYISERRLGFDYLDFKIEAGLDLPQGDIESELHDFRLETVIDSLDPLPYSIAPLPDGRIIADGEDAWFKYHFYGR